MPKASATPQMQPELLALLRAAKLNPDDSSTRQVLADWLEEHGSPADAVRAQFIRLQLEADALDQRSSVRQGLVDRSCDLLREYRDIWLGPLANFQDGCRFERGLLHLEADHNRVVGRASHRLAASDAAAWLDRLLVRGVRETTLDALLTSGLLPHVGHLVIPSAGLGASGTQTLTASPLIRGLVGLDLDYNHIGNGGAEALAESEHLAGLRLLELWINSIGARGAVSLSRSPHLRQLRYLNLGGNLIRAAGMAALADSPVLAHLETFLVWGNEIGQKGAAALARSTSLTQLNTLYLNENRLGPRGIELLAGWPQLARLRLLSLWGNAIGPAGAIALSRTPFEHLRILLLSDNRIGDEGAIALAQSPHCGSLVRLDLHGNGIGDAGARAFLDTDLLPSLVDLNLRDNPVSDPIRAALKKRFPGHSAE